MFNLNLAARATLGHEPSNLTHSSNGFMGILNLGQAQMPQNNTLRREFEPFTVSGQVTVEVARTCCRASRLLFSKSALSYILMLPNAQTSDQS